MKAHSSRNPQSIGGFTLVELMVIVVIVTILAAISFQVARRGIERAHSASCMGNLRQIGVMMNGAAAENNGLYPHGGPPRGWISGLCATMASDYPNTGGKKDATFFRDGAGRIFNCPSDDHGHEHLHKSYLANPWVVGAKTEDGAWLGNGSFSPRRVSTIKQPARVLLVIEDWTRDSAHWRGNGLRYRNDLRKDEENPVHRGGRNFLFADGHVEFLSKDPGLDDEGYQTHYRAR